MLQKYTFLETHKVNNLQKEIVSFLKKIKDVKATDVFDPDLYFPPALAVKVKSMVKVQGKVDKNCELFNKSKAFFDKFKELKTQRKLVYESFIEMNKINQLFDYSTDRITIKELPTSIQKESKALFGLLYEETLTSYDVKSHYEEFSKVQKNNWCPFCGMEQLIHYTHQKQDYDHLLAKSIYPFAAVNMRNLAPMGIDCNRTHKKAKDLIWDEKKQIKAINPYSSKLNIEIVFDGTVLPKSGKRNGLWKLKLMPCRDEVNRWDFIFNISDRIVKDFLTNGKESEYELWLTDYINEKDGDVTLNTIKKVRDSLAKHGTRFNHQSYRNVRYVQASLFKWISEKAPDTFIESIMKMINRKKMAA